MKESKSSRTASFASRLPCPKAIAAASAQDQEATQPVLGLTTPEEQLWCEWFARDHFQNHGDIVELGPWLGSLTRRIQSGLAANPAYRNHPRPLHCYDQFIWKPWCEEQVRGTDLAGQIPLEASFQSLFLQRVAHPLVPVLAREVDLRKSNYPVPDSIEWILNDGLKGWTMARHFAANMLPRLISGGCLAHQDFLWPTEAFLIPLMYCLRPYFSPAYIVPDSCMAVFLRNAAPASELARTVADLPQVLARLDNTFFDKAFAWAEENLNGIDKAVLYLCKATLLWILQKQPAARQIVADHQLATCKGSDLFLFQRDTLRSWRTSELFA